MDKLGETIIFLCVLSVVIFWVGWELIDWLFIDDSIRSEKIITPQIELIINDNIVDTIYVYKLD